MPEAIIESPDTLIQVKAVKDDFGNKQQLIRCTPKKGRESKEVQEEILDSFSRIIQERNEIQKELVKEKIAGGVIEEEEIQEIEEEEPPSAKISGCSKDRKCELKFSEPIYSFDEVIKRRQLQGMDSIDITSKMINFEFLLNSD